MQLWVYAYPLKDPVLHILTYFTLKSIQKMLPSLLLDSLFSLPLLLLQGASCDNVSYSGFPSFPFLIPTTTEKLTEIFSIGRRFFYGKVAIYELEALDEKMGLKQ